MKYWNAVLRITHGCTPVNGGCDQCWAAKEAHMRQFNSLVAQHYRGLTEKTTKGIRFNGQVVVYGDGFTKVMRAKRPKVWQIWNDLFHAEVPDETIAAVPSVEAFWSSSFRGRDGERQNWIPVAASELVEKVLAPLEVNVIGPTPRQPQQHQDQG